MQLGRFMVTRFSHPQTALTSVAEITQCVKFVIYFGLSVQ